MTVIESIIKNLETLPASKLVEVAHFISGLNPNRRNERIAALKATAGCMAGEEGEAFEKAVREEADRIEADLRASLPNHVRLKAPISDRALATT